MKTGLFQLEGEDIKNVINVKRKYVDTGLKYGVTSSRTNSMDFGHWNKKILANSRHFFYDHAEMPYIDYHPEIKELWSIIKNTIGDRALYRTYINGYTYGTDGYAHVDDEFIIKQYGAETLSETIIVYLNDTWDIDWCGETVVFDDDKEIEVSVLPKFGRVFVFNSNKLHAARPLSRSCGVLRSVLVIKTVDRAILSKEVEFLLEHTKGHKHSGKTFFEHLFNTMIILEESKAPKEVCLAGLYHSIYGTEHYPFDKPIERDTVKNLIGTYSESLVYEYCNMKNRVETLLKNTNNFKDEFLRDLLLMEIANLIDQNINGNLTETLRALNIKLASITG